MTSRQRWTWLRRWALPADTALAVLLGVTERFIAPWLGGAPAPLAPVTVLIGATLAAVPLRNRWPLPALVLTTAGAACVLALRGIETFAALAPLLALYTFTVRGDRR